MFIRNSISENSNDNETHLVFIQDCFKIVIFESVT